MYTKLITFILIIIMFTLTLYKHQDNTHIRRTNNIQSSSINLNYKINTIIHQYVPNKNITQDMQTLTDSWKTVNPDYNIIIHDENDIINFFQSSLNKSTFDKLSKDEKVSFFKYCYIYKHGGVWADHNLKCIEPIPIFEDTDIMITLDENYYKQFQITNKFFAFAPNSKILKNVIDTIATDPKTINRDILSTTYNEFFKSNSITKYNIVINENYPDYSLSTIPSFIFGKKQHKILNNNTTIIKNSPFNYQKHLEYAIKN